MKQVKLKITGGTTILDEDDYLKYRDLAWHVNVRSYAKLNKGISRHGKKRWVTFYLHRMVMGLEHGDKKQVDHINRNTLDNRKCNLRIADATLQNINKPLQKNNKSGYRGVHCHRRQITGRWYTYYEALINIRGKSIFLGQSKYIENAIKMRRDAEAKYFDTYGNV